MTANAILKQFVKYGSLVFFLSVLLYAAIFVISYPVFQDSRLIRMLAAICATGLIFIYIYYLMKIKQILYVLKDMNPSDEKKMAAIHKTFESFAKYSIIANMVLLWYILIPSQIWMYIFFGYTNLYYHFYILFICTFVFLFLGYNGLTVWYTRTYPLGRFGIPVAIQRLRSKIISILIPIVLLTSVIIAAVVYNINRIYYTELIDKNIHTSINPIRAMIDSDNIELPLLKNIIKEGYPLVIDTKGNIFFSIKEAEIGKRFGDIIIRGDVSDYLYNNTVSVHDIIKTQGLHKLDGVYDGRFVIMHIYKSAVSDKMLVYILPEDEIYASFYFSIFILTVALYILTFIIWFIASKRLSKISMPLDNIMPAITMASKGDLTQSLKVVKSRDILEDFTRIFISFNDSVRLFMVQSRGITENLLELSTSIEDTGKFIRGSSSDNADLLRESTRLVAGFSNSFSEIADVSKIQNNKVQNFEGSINSLNDSMTVVSSTAQEVVESMKRVESGAATGATLVENTFSGMQNIENFYARINNVILLISDIADQVNLLSLNASIEAARAGDYGRGFAVVAEEISKLADRTGVSVKEITALINEGNVEVKKNKGMVLDMKNSFGQIMERISDAAEKINGFIGMIDERVRESLEIKESIKSISGLSQRMSESTEKQIKNTAEVSETIELVNSAVQNVVEKSEKLSEQSVKLKEMAASLNESLNKYKL